MEDIIQAISQNWFSLCVVLLGIGVLVDIRISTRGIAK